MIVSKFHENRLTIDREIGEKHAILVDNFYCDFGYNWLFLMFFGLWGEGGDEPG